MSMRDSNVYKLGCITRVAMDIILESHIINDRRKSFTKDRR